MRLSALRVDVIQRPIHRQLAQHDDLRNTQQGIATRPLHMIRQVHGHDLECLEMSTKHLRLFAHPTSGYADK